MKIALIGFTGVGKTEIGAALAKHLGIAFCDLDNALEVKHSQTVTELISRHGMESFRDMESETLLELMKTQQSSVVATGGGTLLRPVNRSGLKNNATVIWLQAKPETIWRRVQNKNYVAPLFMTKQDPAAAIVMEMGRRQPNYEEIAQIVISVDGKTPDQIVGEITPALGATR